MPLRSSDPDSDSDSDTTGSGDGLGVSARSSRDGEESEEGSGREGAIVRWRRVYAWELGGWMGSYKHA